MSESRGRLRSSRKGAQSRSRRLPGTKAMLEQRLAEARNERYVLRLYVTGLTLVSRQAIERVRTVCEDHLAGRYALEVVDIYQLPGLARDEQIVATPTLVRLVPAPLRRFIGSLANLDQVLFGGLGLRPSES